MKNKTKIALAVSTIIALGSVTTVNAAHVNNVETYDFKAPFKD